MRLFVAVEPTVAVRSWVAAVGRVLGPLAPRLRWTPPQRTHWTLAFLGEQPEARLEAAREAVSRAAAARLPFQLALGALGAFDSWTKARVLWVGLDSGERELAGLAAALGSELGPRGFSLEKREFSAHLTLARARAPQRLEALRVVELPPLPPPIRVSEVTLLRSFLEPAGARYEALWTGPLG